MKVIRGKKLTSREAARVLGVSEASVKRWADGGLLPMEKTAGGHRRFRPEDIAVARRARLSEEGAADAPERLAAAAARAGAPALAPGGEAELLEATFRTLMEGDDEELSDLLVNLHLQGRSPGAIADHFLCAAMRRIGDLWHRGELSVAQEHVATRTAARALRSLEAATVGGGGDSRGRLALCCSVEEDFHELPVRVAGLTLAGAGYEVFDLGMSTPFSALAETLGRFRPDLVCVSSTVLASLDRAAREYKEFRSAARRRGVRVVLGGAGFADAGVRARMPADLHADSFRQLEEYVASLDAGGS